MQQQLRGQAEFLLLCTPIITLPVNPSTEPFDSRDECTLSASDTTTLPAGIVGNFNENDPLWPGHAIEKREAFLMHAEKAHIFPHNECVKMTKQDGKKVKVETNYEWLDDPADADFNFLYMSAGMHLFFYGSGRGRAIRTTSQPIICIEPLARTVDDRDGVKCFDRLDGEPDSYQATIPIRVWCRSRDTVTLIQSFLSDNLCLKVDVATNLPYFENIFLKCVHRRIFMGREPFLDGESNEHVFVYNKRVPGMDVHLTGAWSLTEAGYMSSTEIMEKCLLCVG
jgi:hypothetical protein